MTYFNCYVYADEIGKPMEESSEIIVRAGTFKRLIEKMGEIMNHARFFDRFIIRYMASTEHNCYVLNSWYLNANEMSALIRRNLDV